MLVVAAIAMLGPYRREAFWTILACGFSKIIEAASLVCHGKMQQTERTDLLASSLTIRGLSGVCALVLAVWLTSSVAIGVLALAFAWLAVLLCYDIPAANSLEVVSESTERFALASLMPLALTALPLGLFAGMNSLMANAPRYFVECELGTRELGVFSAIAYLGLAARAFYTSILNAIVARLADHHHHGELKPFLRIIGKSLIAILALGIAGCLFVAFSGVYILMLFGRDYEDANDVLMLLTASMAMKTLWNLFVSALYAMKQFKVIFILQCTGGLFLFWLLSSWVDRYGLNGAAWAILVGSIFDVVIFSSVTLLILTYNRVHSNR